MGSSPGFFLLVLLNFPSARTMVVGVEVGGVVEVVPSLLGKAPLWLRLLVPFGRLLRNNKEGSVFARGGRRHVCKSCRRLAFAGRPLRPPLLPPRWLVPPGLPTGRLLA